MQQLCCLWIMYISMSKKLLLGACGHPRGSRSPMSPNQFWELRYLSLVFHFHLHRFTRIIKSREYWFLLGKRFSQQTASSLDTRRVVVKRVLKNITCPFNCPELRPHDVILTSSSVHTYLLNIFAKYNQNFKSKMAGNQNIKQTFLIPTISQCILFIFKNCILVTLAIRQIIRDLICTWWFEKLL